MASDGVIQFKLHHRDGPPTGAIERAKLSDLRDALHARGWIGRDPARYGGLGYGNASARAHGDRFLISATQTGQQPTLSANDWVMVTSASAETNELWSEGPSRPSSESLTHAAIYAASPARFVAHIHHPALWRAVCSGALTLAQTPPEATYGTPAMAAALSAISRDATLPFAAAMTGHEDGLMAAAADPQSLLLLLDSLSDAVVRAR